MRKERDIKIKIIKNNAVNNRRLAQFFAKKYIEKRESTTK